MSDETTQTGVQFDADLWQRFREDVKTRNGGIRGHLKHEVENALREYINASEGGDTHDRLTRIESELESIRGAVEEIDQTKKRSGLSKTVENRLEKITETIEDESGSAPRVHEQVVEMAIKKHAGQSKPTLRQYKQLLQDEGEAFEDPRSNQSYFFRDAPRFCNAVNAMYEDGDISKAQYAELVDNEYGRDWWGEQVDTFNQDDSDTPAFQ